MNLGAIGDSILEAVGQHAGGKGILQAENCFGQHISHGHAVLVLTRTELALAVLVQGQHANLGTIARQWIGENSTDAGIAGLTDE